MHHTIVAAAAAAALLATTGAFAQSKGEASYEEHCARGAPQGSAAEQAATRQRCIDEARQAAKSDVPGAANQPGTTAKAGAASKSEKQAAREARRAEGTAVARQPKQDPRNPAQP